MLIKILLAADLLVVTVVGASVNIDSAAAKVVLVVASFTALGVLWRDFIRPAGKIIARTVKAVDALETLPAWRESHNRRLDVVETEVGVVHTDLGDVANDVAAIRRELGITSTDVRRQPRTDPGTREQPAPQT